MVPAASPPGRVPADGSPDAVLVVLAGLPGVGKSTLAGRLADALLAVHLPVDVVEAAVLRAGVDVGQPTGLAAYVVVEALAEVQLAAGRTVVVDAVNDAAPARRQWQGLSERTGVPLRFVEVVCADHETHRRRLSTRRRGLGDFPEPTWESVQQRRAALEAWDGDRLVLDATQPLEHLVDTALAHLRRG